MTSEEMAKVVMDYEDGKLTLAEAKQALKKLGADTYTIREALKCK